MRTYASTHTLHFSSMFNKKEILTNVISKVLCPKNNLKTLRNSIPKLNNNINANKNLKARDSLSKVLVTKRQTLRWKHDRSIFSSLPSGWKVQERKSEMIWWGVSFESALGIQYMYGPFGDMNSRTHASLSRFSRSPNTGRIRNTKENSSHCFL